MILGNQDLIIDLRSEGEYQRGKVPGARNLPLLSNSERAEVGTLYKKVSRLEATQRGLEIFAGKAASFLEQLETILEGKKRFYLYCWRGGMRSRLVGAWLRAMGYEPTVMSGGYKAYRREVLATLEEGYKKKLIVLHGRTGSGKTEIIRACIAKNLPAIDLEGLAGHRGSAFGDLGLPVSTVSQQDFENKLAWHFKQLRDAPFIIIEVESALGSIYLSVAFRRQIASAPVILLQADLENRIARLKEEYATGWSHETRKSFLQRLELVRPYLSRAELVAISAAAWRNDLDSLIKILLESRYDKAYDKGIRRRQHQIIKTFHLGL